MPKALSDGRWACEHPGCKYINTKEGYVRNHEKLKHGGIDGDKTRTAGGKKDSETRVIACPDCKGENVRLLNSNDSTEKAVKAKGYKYICDDCEEVFK